MMGCLTQLFSFTILLQKVLTANILYIAAFGSPSHHVWNKELALGLIQRGHNITMLTHHFEDHLPRNFTIIAMEGLFDVLSKNFDMKKAAETGVLGSIKIMYDFAELCCEYDMKTDGLKKLLSYPNYIFDLIIIDATLTQCMYPIFDKFNNPPVVTANLLPPLLSKTFGNHIYSSYMPYFSSEFTNTMNFSERVLNFIYIHAEYLYQQYIAQPAQFKIAQKHFGKTIRPFEEIEKNMSLVLINIDPNFDYPMALPPNIIPVGGLQIKPPQKLSEDLQQILDGAKHGVILFSLGTNIRSDQLSLEIRKAFLDAFSKLSQVVLWKFETDVIEYLPKNVIVRKWLPQNDILGHPNIKLFITQCGGFSSHETIYHGVPVVGIPFLIDQYSIVKRFVERKLGIALNRNDLKSDNIYGAIVEVLSNPIYRENIRDISRKYRDQPQTALEKGIFWVEYILRHGSVEHLVPASRYISTYQLTNLDVLSTFVLALALLYVFSSFIIILGKFLFIQRSTNKTQ